MKEETFYSASFEYYSLRIRPRFSNRIKSKETKTKTDLILNNTNCCDHNDPSQNIDFKLSKRFTLINERCSLKSKQQVFQLNSINKEI